MPDRDGVFDWDAIADRFFSFHAEKPQAVIVERYDTTQAQVSRWKTHKERVPMRILAKLVELEAVTWDWLLTGEGPKHRRPAAPAGKAKLRPARPERKRSTD